MLHFGEDVEAAGHAGGLIVEPEGLNPGFGHGPGEPAGDVVVGQSKDLEAREGGEDVGDLAVDVGAAGGEAFEGGGVLEGGGDGPGGEAGVVADADGLEAGEAGEEAVGDGLEAVVVEVDFLEGFEAREVGDGAGEEVLLEAEGAEIREAADFGGNGAGEGLGGDVDGADAVGGVAAHTLPVAVASAGPGGWGRGQGLSELGHGFTVGGRGGGRGGSEEEEEEEEEGNWGCWPPSEHGGRWWPGRGLSSDPSCGMYRREREREGWRESGKIIGGGRMLRSRKNGRDDVNCSVSRRPRCSAMDSNGGVETPTDIRREIASLEQAKAKIENRISELQAKLGSCSSENSGVEINSCALPPVESNIDGQLSPDMIHRYSRHLLLPSFGVEAQANLLKSSVLVIGAGGLGSPALLYLAACGVGRLGIVDHDVVELNNLHRQIIHTESYIGRSKVESAAAACRAINSSVQIEEHKEAFRTSNALEIMRKYDIVVDATDNVPSRYMISDCCVVLGKPLISGAALGLEGQLTVYNYNGGPCYRCLFPVPPPTTACQRCADSGVLGVVPGIIGCLQALEAIKVAAAVGEPLSGRMLLFDSLSARTRVVKLRGRSLQCEACGENATLNEVKFRHFDYENFTQYPLSTSPLKLNLLPDEARITSMEYNDRKMEGESHVLLDVRPEHHYKIVSLPNSLNIPLTDLEKRLPEIATALARGNGSDDPSLYVVCRRGNDSQIAVECLRKMGYPSAKDIVGGLESWANDVDGNFPIY
ncbi:adenylyltransferase and sulfurtransferase MOCS3 [Andrographis paniculata]|uniref:adenylyltransferase and sulfurtransferase MOCS3 n=1 Tax=Andrographis paniculata TaxID=175694 RepID=UPI0021E901C7|nr:adenylyltransferase and sulfurtransferase MOCS3 [Andrographis paniculata]